MIKDSVVRFYSLVLLSISIFSSCSKHSAEKVSVKKEETPVVSVNSNTLYLSDLEKVIPEGLDREDSTTAADAYVKRWINEELIYEKAKQNIPDQSQIDQLVEDYRQSLTIYTYLEQLLRDALAKKISENDLQSYYNQNSENLKLETCLIKGLFLKVPASSPELPNLRKWYQSNSAESRENIRKASIQNAVIYDYFYDKWLNLEDITVNMPHVSSDLSQFVKSNKNFETSDSTFVYLLHIESYALPGATAPYEYVKSQIFDILMSKSREEFLTNFETDLYKNAQEKNNIKFYNKNKDE